MGTTFGKYEIIRPLASGGMGEVLLARQLGAPGFERLVVVKKVLSHLSHDPEFVQRFLDEMRLAAMLNHGNIVQVYEAGECGGEYYMAMEYVDGLNLKEVLATLRAKAQRMPEQLALYILGEVAKALDYAHTKTNEQGLSLGIVHRDVSPANLLLSWDGQVKLTDFGVAKAAARLAESLPGTLHGKVYYMSPEQVCGLEVDARSDIFSLGTVAYELLAGERPFDGETDVAVIEAVRRCTPPSLAQVAPWVPASLRAIVARAMARERSDRYSTMHEFHQAISAYMLEAHTIVSARTLADFLSQLRETPQQSETRSLDKVAQELLPSSHPSERQLSQTRTASIEPIAKPVPSQRHSWVKALVAVILLIVGGLVVLITSQTPEDASTFTEITPAIVEPMPIRGPEPLVLSPPVIEVGRESESQNVRRSPAAVVEERRQAEPTPRRGVRIKTIPEGAEVWAGEKLLGSTPLDVPLPKAGSLQVELRADGYEPRTLSIMPDSPPPRTITLKRIAMGKVKFRFFPADAHVTIDNRPYRLENNLVSLDLPEGTHVLYIRTLDGKYEKVVNFTVRALETTELGTIEVITGQQGGGT